MRPEVSELIPSNSSDPKFESKKCNLLEYSFLIFPNLVIPKCHFISKKIKHLYQKAAASSVQQAVRGRRVTGDRANRNALPPLK